MLLGKTQAKAKTRQSSDQPSPKTCKSKSFIESQNMSLDFPNGISAWQLMDVCKGMDRWVDQARNLHLYQSWLGAPEMQCDARARYGRNIAARTPACLQRAARRLKTLHTFTKVNPFRGQFYRRVNKYCLAPGQRTISLRSSTLFGDRRGLFPRSDVRDIGRGSLTSPAGDK